MNKGSFGVVYVRAVVNVCVSVAWGVEGWGHVSLQGCLLLFLEGYFCLSGRFPFVCSVCFSGHA